MAKYVSAYEGAKRDKEKKGLYSATQKIMAYNSNRIEGSTLTSEQTASLFDTGTLVSNGIEVYKAKIQPCSSRSVLYIVVFVYYNI